MNGIPTTVWFDRPDISPHTAEDINNVNEMCDYLDGLVAQEWNKHGIPASRIIVGKNAIFYIFRYYDISSSFDTPYTSDVFAF